MSIETTVKADATTALTWFQKHERIVIVFLVLAAGTWIGNKFLDLRADRADRAASAAIAQLDVQKTANAQLATQITQLNGQYQNLQVQIAQHDSQLISAMQSRVTVLHDQQQTDKTMPLPELGSRWASLAGVAPADISASTAGITVSDNGARQTVQQLEQIPVLQANLKDETAIADDRKQQIDKGDQLITGLNSQVTGLNVQIVDQDKACDAKLKAAKADAAKGKWKWFRIGYVAGFLSDEIARHIL